MSLINDICQQINPMTLDAMSTVRLMDRIDTKFICSIPELAEILRRIAPDYRVLEINGKRILDYQTRYFDTSHFSMYFDHQDGKVNRYKVRERIYKESGDAFLEVKFKNVQNRTVKSRIVRNHRNHRQMSDRESQFLLNHSPYRADILEFKILNSFRRITLGGNKERVTIDIDLRFSDGNDRVITLPPFAILEVKQESSSMSTPIMKALAELNIGETGVSKYCVGVASIYPHIQTTRIKPILDKIAEFNAPDSGISPQVGVEVPLG